MPSEHHVTIRQEYDIVTARQVGRDVALQVGFTGSDLGLIATAISELARNIVSYAQQGQIIIDAIESRGKRGILVVAEDQGPGIFDVTLAMRDGYSTGNSLGLGLPGTKRLMDEFEIVSEVGKGTRITAKKWVKE